MNYSGNARNDDIFDTTLLLYLLTIIMRHMWINCESDVCDVFHLAQRMGFPLIEPMMH